MRPLMLQVRPAACSTPTCGTAITAMAVAGGADMLHLHMTAGLLRMLLLLLLVPL